MDRRFVFIGLASGVISSAFAQGSGTPSPMGGGAAPARGAPMGTLEVEHGKKTAIAGAGTLQTSNAALTKAVNPKVKQFAQFEREEQTAIAQVLELIDPSLGAARPESKTSASFERLNGMSGAEFDKAFVTSQIEGHQILLAIQEEYIKAGRNREHLGIAKLSLAQIKEHLVLLSELQKAI